ncbi:MAG: hypothetical protein AMXMBFR4_24110 [Candidatus Hydrogenedentota bacterium]
MIDSQFDKGYQCSAADIDRDGRPDVIALSTTPPQLVWYRNPEWTRFVVTTATERNIDVAPHDVDGDGDIDGRPPFCRPGEMLGNRGWLSSC